MDEPVRTRKRLEVVDADRIDWIEADGDYVRLHTGAKSHLIRGTMASLEERLDPERFLRVHRSAIVQLDRVRQLEPQEDGTYVAVLKEGQRVRISRSYRDAVFERLGLRW